MKTLVQGGTLEITNQIKKLSINRIEKGYIDTPSLVDLIIRTKDMSKGSRAGSKYIDRLPDSEKAQNPQKFVTDLLFITSLSYLNEILMLNIELKQRNKEILHWQDLLEMVSKEELEKAKSNAPKNSQQMV